MFVPEKLRAFFKEIMIVKFASVLLVLGMLTACAADSYSSPGILLLNETFLYQVLTGNKKTNEPRSVCSGVDADAKH